ncbi:MAG: coenzyme F420-0:L-glutamate ligase [Alphaproteobacteria bacterium]|nr:coenzyme F420-0:L-glutamate ligase [Alphaproteobacteria bacterium]
MLSLIALPGLPLIKPGDELASILITAMDQAALRPRDGDVLVVAQKIVSKAEGRFVDLATVRPSAQAKSLAAEIEKDPRLVEVILSESRRVVRKRPNVLIVEHRLGFIMANAGVDRSNVAGAEAGEQVLLLPRDPDGSAEALRIRLSERFGARLAVIINDSFGRPWRRGTVGVALGAAGLPTLLDMRGRPDLFGRPLEVTITAFADEIAAAASLLMGQANERQPAIWLSGLDWSGPAIPAAELVRPASEDLFR